MVSIILPCLNEEQTVGQAVAKAYACLKACDLSGEVIVVDNGSTDNSAALARAAGAIVISESVRGYGAALRRGFAASSREWILYADADLTYDFQDMTKFKEFFLKAQPALILGSRLKGNISLGAMPFLHRYFGTPVLSSLLRGLHGLPVSDCNSGMRAFHKSLKPMLSGSQNGMEYASEMLVCAAPLKGKYHEVPISYLKSEVPRQTHLRPWRDGLKHLGLIVRSAFRH